MTLAILATGDEIIHGDTLNTNGHEIAKILSSEGVPLGLQLACSDKEQELFDSVEFLAKHHDIIVSIGGLGPTTDDRTRFAFAKYFDVSLIEFPEAMRHIEKRLRYANLPMDNGNCQQALFPKSATLLPNPNGTAMGCLFQEKLKLVVLLPGPPGECLPMFNHYVLPILQKTAHSQKQMLTWQLFGVAEARVGAMLEAALKGLICNTGYRLDSPYLEFKVRCNVDVLDEVKRRIDPLVAPFIISPPKQKASRLLAEYIGQLDKSVVILDKATGGVLETLVRNPDNYHNLHFYPTAGARFVFEISGLEVFWASRSDASHGVLKLNYQIGQCKGEEQHEVPYRGNRSVLHHSAEWLSFRILQRIQQVH